MAALQAPPSLQFFRQEHWIGLPFPSPMHESEKWKGSRSVMSDSVRPHRRQPTRLLHPWDSPGKNTGVGCHFLLQCRKMKSESEVTQSCPTPSHPHGLQPTRLLCPRDFPGKSTGVGCHCLLQNINYSLIISRKIRMIVALLLLKFVIYLYTRNLSYFGY